jgi:hypothetical protein
MCSKWRGQAFPHYNVCFNTHMMTPCLLIRCLFSFSQPFKILQDICAGHLTYSQGASSPSQTKSQPSKILWDLYARWGLRTSRGLFWDCAHLPPCTGPHSQNSPLLKPCPMHDEGRVPLKSMAPKGKCLLQMVFFVKTWEPALRTNSLDIFKSTGSAGYNSKYLLGGILLACKISMTGLKTQRGSIIVPFEGSPNDKADQFSGHGWFIAPEVHNRLQ